LVSGSDAAELSWQSGSSRLYAAGVTDELTSGRIGRCLEPVLDEPHPAVAPAAAKVISITAGRV
jgi:hypothetical protein